MVGFGTHRSGRKNGFDLEGTRAKNERPVAEGYLG